MTSSHAEKYNMGQLLSNILLSPQKEAHTVEVQGSAVGLG